MSTKKNLIFGSCVLIATILAVLYSLHASRVNNIDFFKTTDALSNDELVDGYLFFCRCKQGHCVMGQAISFRPNCGKIMLDNPNPENVECWRADVNCPQD